jgi:hypothetical protein
MTKPRSGITDSGQRWQNVRNTGCKSASLKIKIRDAGIQEKAKIPKPIVSQSANDLRRNSRLEYDPSDFMAGQ